MSVPPPALGTSDFQKYRIADVSVEGVEIIRSWPAEEEAFIAASSPDPETVNLIRVEPAASSPPLRAHLQRTLAARFRSEFAAKVNSVFTGSRPVKAVVRLKMFDVPSGARRVFTDNDAKIQASIDLVEAGTGAPVLRYDGPYRSRKLVGGLATGIALAFENSDLGASLIADYMADYRNWLLRN